MPVDAVDFGWFKIKKEKNGWKIIRNLSLLVLDDRNIEGISDTVSLMKKTTILNKDFFSVKEMILIKWSSNADHTLMYDIIVSDREF